MSFDCINTQSACWALSFFIHFEGGGDEQPAESETGSQQAGKLEH